MLGKTCNSEQLILHVLFSPGAPKSIPISRISQLLFLAPEEGGTCGISQGRMSTASSTSPGAFQHPQETSAPRAWLGTPQFSLSCSPLPPFPASFDAPARKTLINHEENILGLSLPRTHAGVALPGRLKALRAHLKSRIRRVLVNALQKSLPQHLH